MPIIDQTSLNEYIKNNKDPYGSSICNVAIEAMRMLDKDLTPLNSDTRTAHGLIREASKSINARISGFMASCVAQMVAQCHSRGEEFWQLYKNETAI